VPLFKWFKCVGVTSSKSSYRCCRLLLIQMLSPRFISYTSIALHIDIMNLMVSKSWSSLGLWYVWTRDYITGFQNAFAVSRPSFVADTIGRLNAVKHFPYMSSNMRRLESNVCLFYKSDVWKFHRTSLQDWWRYTCFSVVSIIVVSLLPPYNKGVYQYSSPLNVVLSRRRRLVIRVMVCSQVVFKRTKQVKSDVERLGM